MSTANPLRGEVPLPLGDQLWCLRPSFARLVEAEAEAGSLFQLLDRAADGDIRLADAESLFWCCLDGERPEREAFRESLSQAGMRAIVAPYRKLLAQLFAAS